MTNTENTQSNCYVRRNVTLAPGGYGDKWCVSTLDGKRVSAFGTREWAESRLARLPR